MDQSGISDQDAFTSSLVPSKFFAIIKRKDRRLEQFRSKVNREAILSDWKNCSTLENQSISYSEML